MTKSSGSHLQVRVGTVDGPAPAPLRETALLQRIYGIAFPTQEELAAWEVRAARALCPLLARVWILRRWRTPGPPHGLQYTHPKYLVCPFNACPWLGGTRLHKRKR